MEEKIKEKELAVNKLKERSAKIKQRVENLTKARSTNLENQDNDITKLESLKAKLVDEIETKLPVLNELDSKENSNDYIIKDLEQKIKKRKNDVCILEDGIKQLNKESNEMLAQRNFVTSDIEKIVSDIYISKGFTGEVNIKSKIQMTYSNKTRRETPLFKSGGYKQKRNPLHENQTNCRCVLF